MSHAGNGGGITSPRSTTPEPPPFESADASGTTRVSGRLLRVADHWGLVLAYGLVTMALGVVLAVWPGSTLVVLAILFAVQLIVSGIIRMVSAVAASGLDGTVRTLLGLTGAFGLLIGLLCLRSPLQTLTAIGLLVGIYWLVTGLVDVMNAILGTGDRGRLWNAVLGLLSIIAGVYLLLNPAISLAALVILGCVWLFGYGFIAIVAALSMRSASKRQQSSTETLPASPSA
jgi:uncharacterized membrane protein HdeD (DUF308 family)